MADLTEDLLADLAVGEIRSIISKNGQAEMAGINTLLGFHDECVLVSLALKPCK